MSVESVFANASMQAAKYLGATVLKPLRLKRAAEKFEHPVAQKTIAEFLERLTPATANQLYEFIGSTHFEFLAHQVLSWQATGWDDGRRVELLHDIRSRLGVIDMDRADVWVGAEIFLQALNVVVAEAAGRIGAGDQPKAAGPVVHLACQYLRDNDFAAYLRQLSTVYQYSQRLRAQVAALRSKLRLVHLASGPEADYTGLHVEPTFGSVGDSRRAVDGHELLSTFSRLVVLGDPGAGKSTFAAKLAFDLATDRVPGFAGTVPFLLVVRDHAHMLDGGRMLTDFLDSTSRSPYSMTPPEHGLEFLLSSGDAFVIVDGVDELRTAEARRRFGELVEGFAHRYPATRMVVTSRIIGYGDAPLNPLLFHRARVQPFTVAQCGEYASRWFALDGESTPVQQKRMARGFIAETDSVDDLRRNPLLLSLLCSLYASKHYIPRHRTEIYEQCAELLFERWDKRREISVPLKYVVDVRPAIAELAWKLFRDPLRRQALRKREILHFLTRYLREERYATDHEAAAAAEDFLAFCAGRAWVLTEIGTAHHEQLYGFTHSTFLEYFAALRLVRQTETVEATWQELRPRIGDASWSVVSELAVQILDRNNNGGANRFVSHLVSDKAEETESTRLSFAARLTSHLTLNNLSLQGLCTRAVDRSCAVPAGVRRGFLDPVPRAAVRAVDGPLSDLLTVSLPENASRVATYVIDALLERSAATNVDWSENTPDFLLAFLRTFSRQGNETAEHITSRMGDVLLPPGARRWEALFDPGPEELREHGLQILYEETLVGQVGLASNAQVLLALALTVDQGDAFRDYLGWRLPELYELMLSQPWPWLTSSASHMLGYSAVRDEIALLAPRVSTTRFMRMPRRERSAVVLLLLPYTQLFRASVIDSSSSIVNLLSFARHHPGRIDLAIRMIDQWDLEPHAYDLLSRYLGGEASPIG
ncbi:NACHT domain-containing protein [Micromonospora schwarzwaldensis]|uniref:NACHT domain-containing protein n=1 Tax=Micromonospora sp. DSM 45708 TaxID=3111767 RepID=UPI0031D85ADA